jgi:hypothetical protein
MAFCLSAELVVICVDGRLRGRDEREEYVRNNASLPIPRSLTSPLHHVDVFDRDGAPIAVVNDDDGEADGGLARRHREDE